MQRRMQYLGIFLLALAVCVSAGAKTKELSAFTQVQVCTPFNVVIAPATSKTSQYSLSIDGDADVQKAVGASVKSGVLTLASTGSFTTSKPVKVTVRLPASKLTGVTASSATGITVVVSKGFDVKTLTAIVQGSGDLYIPQVKATTLKVINSGTGDMSISGTIGKATVQASGTGTTYISGATGPVSVAASGTSAVLINSPNDKVQITGKVSGISSLDYNRGICKVSASGLGEACNKKSVKEPRITTLWTCGLKLSGTFGCSTGSSSSSSSSGDGSSTSSSFGGGTSSSNTHISSSGGGSAFASSSSIPSGSSSSSSGLFGDDDFFNDNDFFFASSNPSSSHSSSSSSPGSSTLTTNTGKLSSQKCEVSSNQLKMA